MKPLLLSFALCLSLAAPAGAESARLTLDQAIARALATHPDAAIAGVQLKQAELGIVDVTSQRLQLSADASVLSRHAQTGLLASAGGASSTSDQTALNGTFGLTVPLFTGWKLTNGLTSAERNRDAAAYQRAMTRAELTFEVTRAFWTLVRQEELAKLQTETLEQSRRTLALTRASHGLGRLTTQDVDRAEVDSLNTQDALLRQVGQIREAQARLASLLGMPTGELQIQPSLSTVGPLAMPDAERALEEHPRVKAAEARVLAAEASVRSAQGDRWPQLALITTYQHGNNPLDPLSGVRGIGSFSGTWDARLSAALNVFDNGRIAREIARAEGELAIARANLTKTRREVHATIELALIRAKSAQDRVALAERSGGIAAKTLTWVETRYEQGYSLLVEVHDTRRSLLSARTQRIEAQVDLEIARAELALALARAE